MRRSNGNECLCNRLVRRLKRLSQREIGSDLYPGRIKPAIDSAIEDGMNKCKLSIALLSEKLFDLLHNFRRLVDNLFHDRFLFVAR